MATSKRIIARKFTKKNYLLLAKNHWRELLEIVELLLSYNADLKQKDMYGNSLLITAIQSAIQNENKLAIIQCLLKYGADVNQLTAFDSSPLLIAIMYNYPFAIHELFKYKASAQEKDPCGCPLLRLTLTWMKNEAIAKLFLQNGADPNSQDKHGESTFCIAIKMGTVSLVKTFLEHGANLMGKDMKGNIPLMVAAQYKKMEISKLLFERMCEKQGIVETLCSLPCLAICWEFVLEKIENVIKAHGHERMQLLQRSNELIKNALMQSLDRIYIETLQKKISQAYFGGLSSL